MIPTLRPEIEAAENLLQLWLELNFRLIRAYGAQPKERELIEGIWKYARYCWKESKNPAVSQVVLTGFFEEILLEKSLREDLPNRLSQREFEEVARYLSRLLDENEFKKYAQEFLERRKPGN